MTIGDLKLVLDRTMNQPGMDSTVPIVIGTHYTSTSEIISRSADEVLCVTGSQGKPELHILHTL